MISRSSWWSTVLENRFPDKPKFEYEWKGESSNLAELKVIDKYVNGLFTDYCTPEPSELDGTPEVDGALVEARGAHEVLDVPEVQDTHVHINPEVVDVPGVPDALKVQNAPGINMLQELLNILKSKMLQKFMVGQK